jgi:hypothetical protein
MKYLIWLLPIGFVWLAFYIGFTFALTPFLWYTFPYVFTCACIFIFLSSIAIKVCE